MRNMYSLQFWNDIFFNCVIVIDIYNRQGIANLSYVAGKAKMTHSEGIIEIDEVKAFNDTLNSFANNQYSIVLFGIFVGNMIARAGIYEYFKGRFTTKVGFA